MTRRDYEPGQGPMRGVVVALLVTALLCLLGWAGWHALVSILDGAA